MSEITERHYLQNGRETLADAREALEWASETRATMVDLKFCDLLGTWQHVSLPITAFEESAFDEGLGFDGSSIRGWQAIQDSDMLSIANPAARAFERSDASSPWSIEPAAAMRSSNGKTSSATKRPTASLSARTSSGSSGTITAGQPTERARTLRVRRR